MGTGMKGSYLGFTFNGIHSSYFGITRTSDGSRFNQGLLPTIQDKAAQVPGRPGSVLQSSNYGTKVFSVSFAYDSVTESQLQEMSVWLGDKKIHELIFDEAPYKHWYAKVTGNASMKWIPFGEGDTGRIYKGEGTIQFTCYEPFAHCNYKWYEEKENELTNKDEWFEASKLERAIDKNSLVNSSSTLLKNSLMVNEDKMLFEPQLGFQMSNNYMTLDNLKITSNGFLTNGEGTSEMIGNMYNCGDLETDFKLIIPIIAGQNCPEGSVSLNGEKKLAWGTFAPSHGETSIVINTKMNLIEGVKNGKKTGQIYDQYLIVNDYFKLPVGEFQLNVDINGMQKVEIDFDYLYF